MPNHMQVNLAGIDVDEGLANLLEGLWEAGISTQFSCQGNPGVAMILFPTVTDGLRFVEETLAATGTYGCYAGRLSMHISHPWPASDGPSRFVVEWPPAFTPVWEAAWNGEAMPLSDVLAICEGLEASHCPVAARREAEALSDRKGAENA